MTPFVHLHVHTEYSMLDGALRIGKMFQTAKKMGMPAIAITDHGNMFGAVAFNKAAVKLVDPDADPFKFVKAVREGAKAYDVKPIFGCEFYVAPDMGVKQSEGLKNMPKLNHIVLLAKNMQGYKNLVKLTSKSYVDGFYYKPRIDYALLKEHCAGLVCLSACLAGSIPQALLRGDKSAAEQYVDSFVEMFGSDFYIELQNHGIRDQKKVLPQLISLAREKGVKVVATNDVHYETRDDYEMQKVLQCISFRTTIDEERPAKHMSDGEEEMPKEGEQDSGDYFPTDEFYLKSGDEMKEIFGHIQGAIENTLEIADKCNVSILEKEKLFPNYIPPDGIAPYDYLRTLTYEGLKKKYGEITDAIRERAEYELSTINDLGFVEYYLIVWDFINYAESKGIPVGPGRGSGVGSIVAYATSITKVDPIKYDLFFERFLNRERVSAPDFDIDFCVDRRGEVIDYVVKKYGAARVSQIVTFGTLAPKNAIKDVARVYNFPFSEVNKITKAMPGLIKNPIAQLVGREADKKGEYHILPDLKEMYDADPAIRKIIDMASKVEGLPRQTGMHAAGVIICREDIDDHVPLQRSGDDITTQFNKDECEELGLLKMDFLGLRTLTDIKMAVDLVKKDKGIDIDFYDMEYDDPEVYKMIGEGDTHAVFQLESGGMKRFMANLKPESLEDIIAGISLYRPGPMDSIDQYVHNKKNPGEVVYDDPILEPCLKVTYGIIVYQEQVMRIVQDMAGYSLGRADIIRRVMGKKKAEEMAKEKLVFLEGCKAKGLDVQVAVKIFDQMEKFASYAFNKSHAAAYAYVAYQTAYLKRYHLTEFITAVLNNRISNISELSNYLVYAKENNITILCPDINHSEDYYTVEGKSIRIGLGAIKNVGMGVIESVLLERRKNGDFKSLNDFVTRMHAFVTKKLMESFILSGVFDCFKVHRSQMMCVYEGLIDRAAKDGQARAKGQFSMFDIIGGDDETTEYPDIKEYPPKEKYAKEKEMLGIYVSGSPLDEYKDKLMQYQINSRDFTYAEESDDTAEQQAMTLTQDQKVRIGGMLTEPKIGRTKKGSLLSTARLEDLYGSVAVMTSGDKAEKLRIIWKEGKMLNISGKVSIREGEEPVVWIDFADEWKEEKKESTHAKKLCMYFDIAAEGETFLENIISVLEAYPGGDLAYIKDTATGGLQKLKEKIEICTALESELGGMLPKGSIKIV